jgi:hypothetical protein
VGLLLPRALLVVALLDGSALLSLAILKSFHFLLMLLTELLPLRRSCRLFSLLVPGLQYRAFLCMTRIEVG